MGSRLRTMTSKPPKLTTPQRRYLKLGLKQPGGKLPLFDSSGQRIHGRTIKSCMDQGLCEPWFRNPIKPDWLVCKLTDKGRETVLVNIANRG